MSERVIEDRLDPNPQPTVLGRVCRVLFANPRLASLRRRSGRRMLAIGYVLVLAAMPVVGALMSALWVLLLLVPYTIATLLVAASIEGLMDKPLSRLDERQRKLRQTVFREPYPVGAALGIAGGLAIGFALDASEGVMLGTMLFVLGFVFMLPSLALAWRLPDEVDDGE